MVCWESLGGTREALEQGYGNDVSRWRGMLVESGRMRELRWKRFGFTGTIPRAIDELDGLTILDHIYNQISGPLPRDRQA